MKRKRGLWGAFFLALLVVAIAATYPVYNHFEQGGMRWVIVSAGSLDVESGGELDIESGGALKLAGTQVTSSAAELNLADGQTATAAEVNKLDNAGLGIFFASAAGGANVNETTIRVVDAAGTVYVTEPYILTVWLSDASDGTGLTGTSASGTVAAKSGEGTDLNVDAAKKCTKIMTDTDGSYVLEITDSAKTGFYVGCTIPGTGATAVSSQVGSAAFAGYGS